MTLEFSVSGMSCDGCESSVEEAVGELHGVEGVDADSDTDTVTVEGDPSTTEVLAAIEEAGYTVSEDAA